MVKIPIKSNPGSQCKHYKMRNILSGVNSYTRFHRVLTEFAIVHPCFIFNFSLAFFKALSAHCVNRTYATTPIIHSSCENAKILLTASNDLYMLYVH